MQFENVSGKEEMRIGLILPDGKREVTSETSRVASLFAEFSKIGIPAELVLYSDEKVNEVESQISQLNLVMVWVNPIHKGRDRSLLNSMLKRVANKGIFVSTHPDIIHKMGTKDVLYQTRKLDWGSNVTIYKNKDEFTEHFPTQLRRGPRVLKQYHGSSGDGVWKVELLSDSEITLNTKVLVLHAKRGSLVEKMNLSEFISKMDQYFSGSGYLIDQEFQSRLSEGMTRCYMTLDRVIGFGHQFVTALLKPSDNEPLQPPPRYYYSKEKSEFEQLRNLLESKWISQMQKELDIPTSALPLLWDTDFLLGSKDKTGNDTYVLCEINVSSVYPYPEVGNSDIVNSVKQILLS